MRKILFGLAMLMTTIVSQAQAFHSTVKIEFEKVVYVRQQVRETSGDWYDMIKDRLPEKVVSYYEFTGDTSRSLFKQSKEPVIASGQWYESMADNNIVYNNYMTGRTITQKPVAEETFLVDDSLANIKWKLTADTRTIAGYDCRKAIGFIGDTLAVFAFYTDEILIPGGPESSNGLPGMILGLGVPRLHATWFATKVEVNGVSLAKLQPATKGKKVTRKSMMDALDNVLKNWGKYGSRMRLYYVL